MISSAKKIINRRVVGGNVWLEHSEGAAKLSPNLQDFKYEVLESEEAVGRAMFDELAQYSIEKAGDIVMVLLGGRGAQAMYRIINQLSQTEVIDDLLARL